MAEWAMGTCRVQIPREQIEQLIRPDFVRNVAATLTWTRCAIGLREFAQDYQEKVSQ